MRRVGRRGSKEVREIAGWLRDEMCVSNDKSLLLFLKEWEHGGGEKINGEGKGSRALRGRTELHDMIGLRRIRGMTIIHDNPVSLLSPTATPLSVVVVRCRQWTSLICPYISSNYLKPAPAEAAALRLLEDIDCRSPSRHGSLATGEAKPAKVTGGAIR